MSWFTSAGAGTCGYIPPWDLEITCHHATFIMYHLVVVQGGEHTQWSLLPTVQWGLCKNHGNWNPGQAMMTPRQCDSDVHNFSPPNFAKLIHDKIFLIVFLETTHCTHVLSYLILKLIPLLFLHPGCNHSLWTDRHANRIVERVAGSQGRLFGHRSCDDGDDVIIPPNRSLGPSRSGFPQFSAWLC